MTGDSQGRLPGGSRTWAEVHIKGGLRKGEIFQAGFRNDEKANLNEVTGF